MSDSDVVIRVEGLGKKYALHHETSERYTALRDVVARQAKAAGRLLNPFTLTGQLRKAQREAAQERAESEEEFWALKDVSFEIRRGERVGIIGRNGAGKSTLLKILSRITEPTTGRVEIRGRVASLLEVGTGFHPELTGRENIYLNGSILGMSRIEIKSRFDEIVDFAEVERFLDTPVKRYSSGMYVKLAFSVAASLEQEVLIIDEVLSVGDTSFQSKCIGKINKFSDQGRTVLFVSHNMGALRKVCQRGLFLQAGKCILTGSMSSIIETYMESALRGSARGLGRRSFLNYTKPAFFTDIRCKKTIESGDELKIETDITATECLENIDLRISIYDQRGACLFHFGTWYSDQNLSLGVGKKTLALHIPNLRINSGNYSINISLSQSAHGTHEIFDRVEEAAVFSVTYANPFGTGKTPSYGAVFIDHKWLL